MTRDEVAEKARKVVMEALGVTEEQVTEEATFDDDLGADSLDKVELILMIEEEFGFEIRDDEANTWNTFGDAVNGLMKLGAYV